MFEHVEVGEVGDVVLHFFLADPLSRRDYLWYADLGESFRTEFQSRPRCLHLTDDVIPSAEHLQLLGCEVLEIFER